MLITKAEMQELERLRSFAERTFRIAYEQQNDPVRFENYCLEAFSIEGFRKQMEHPGSAFWMAWETDMLAAYLKLNFDRHPVELNSMRTVQVERIYVEPALQGQRIGEKLLDLANDQARERQAEWIWLGVWQERENALRFYERCGYEIFGTEVFWLGDEAQTDWLLRKKVIL